jgi:hypothetical protein
VALMCGQGEYKDRMMVRVPSACFVFEPLIEFRWNLILERESYACPINLIFFFFASVKCKYHMKLESNISIFH